MRSWWSIGGVLGLVVCTFSDVAPGNYWIIATSTRIAVQKVMPSMSYLIWLQSNTHLKPLSRTFPRLRTLSSLKPTHVLYRASPRASFKPDQTLNMDAVQFMQFTNRFTKASSTIAKKENSHPLHESHLAIIAMFQPNQWTVKELSQTSQKIQ